MLPKALDEKVTKPYLKKLGTELHCLHEDEASCIGFLSVGLFKPDYYRY